MKVCWASITASTPTPRMTVVSAVSSSVNPPALRRSACAAKVRPRDPGASSMGDLAPGGRRDPARRSRSVPCIGYRTIWLILKMGRMIAMAMNPTIDPMMMIMTGSIMLVAALMASRNCLV